MTPVIPDIYREAISPQQQIHDICCALKKLSEWSNELGYEVKLNHDAIDALEQQFQQFIDSGFADYYLDEIETWLSENLPDVIQTVLKMIFFGLTDDGYFCAYVPKSWSNIIFGTIADYDSENYGHLTIGY